MNGQQVNLEEIGQRWGALLTQAFAQIITLEKQLAQERAEKAMLLKKLGKSESRLSPEIAEVPIEW